MTVIVVSIEESEEQIISGIPKYVILTTNTPSTIFYTLDGTIPTTFSLVYLDDKLLLPTDQNTVIFKFFATNGTDSSTILSKTYRPNISNLRKQLDSVSPDQVNQIDPNAIFPYGESGSTLPISFGPTKSVDIVDSPDISNTIADGYDSAGSTVYDIDKPLDKYLFIYSETNAQGERGHGIGTLPTEVKFTRPKEPPEETDVSSKLFNPKAMVIYQDSREEPIDPNITILNRQFFSFGSEETIRDGALLQATEKLAHSGSFLKSYFNPRDNTMTYYYFDSRTLKWIISKEPYTPKGPTSLWKPVVLSSKPGAQFVHKWYTWKKNTLY